MSTLPVEDLDTPAVLIDLDRLQRNVERMAASAAGAGVRLRPHAKTHKIPEIGRLQMRAGARGLTLAKIGEAEVFADSGFTDLFLAYPIVGSEKALRLLALADRLRLAVGADSVEGVRPLGETFHAAGRSLDVLVEIDTGLHRTGVAPERAAEVSARIAELPGLTIRGIFTHAGHAYGGATPAEVAAIGSGEGERMVAAAEAIRSAGLPVEEVSVGSTPSARSAMQVAGVTECRPGTYVFNDASQVSLGICSLEDCAMTVLATVVSVPAPDRAIVDAGSKTLSSDPLRPRPVGHGFLIGRSSRVDRLSEEHGVIRVDPGEAFHVGERVRIVPNHACVVTNLHDRVFAIRSERVEAQWRVAARGRVT
jgi:D-serine deaminase-like pyridoxal phosphate-dependent protein